MSKQGESSPCVGIVKCPLDFSNLVENTFLPGAKEPRLRFANACKGKVDGVKLDLLITPVSDEPPASLSAGQYQNYGRISLQSGEHVELNFALMMSGTVHPQMVDSVIFSVLDLDRDRDLITIQGSL